MALGHVREAALDQAVHHGDDRVEVLGDARLEIGRGHAECGQVLVVEVGVPARDDADVDLLLGGGLVDLVVDVRDVARVQHARVAPAQHPRQHVEHHGGPRVADVRIGVHGRAG
jgi:hypothetical protein